MIPPAPPLDEAARLAALAALDLLDTDAEPAFDALAELAAATLGTPIGLLSLVDRDRQWFKARAGLAAMETPRDVSFCGHAILGETPLVVSEAEADVRFFDNPLVTGAPFVKSYLGAPVTSPQGFRIGTVCVIDHRPRAWTDEDIGQVMRFATIASSLVRQRQAVAEAEARVREAARLSRILAERQAMLAQAARIARVGGWRLVTGADPKDSAGKTAGEVRFGPTTAELLGADPEAGASGALLAPFGPEHRPIVAAAIEAGLAGEDFDLTVPTTPADDGAVRWLRLSGRPEGEAGALVGAVQDVTAHRARDHALERALADIAAYQTALDRHAIVAMTDGKGTIVFVNDRFCEISGYAREELIGQNHRILNSGTHPKSFFVEMWRAIGRGKTWRSDICNKSKAGELYWVDTTIVPLLAADGKPERYLSIRYDITERVENESRLRSVRDSLANVLEASNTGVWEVNLENNTVILDHPALRQFGVFGEGRPTPLSDWQQVCHPDDLEAVRHNLRQHVKGETESYETQFRIRRGAGEWVWLLSRGRVVERGPDGRAVLMRGTHTDITEARSIKTELERALGQISGFFDLLLDPLCICGFDGKFVRLNHAWEAMLGVKTEELLQRPFLDFVHADDVAATEAKMADLIRGAPVINFINRFRRTDGSYRHLEWRATPSSGLIYAAARDVTDRIAHEAELDRARAAAESANRAKSAFLANMSHEIRTPLNGVIGVADALARTPLDSRQQEMVELVRASGETLERLLGDILDVSKMEAGKLDLCLAPFDLHREIETAAQLMRARAEEKAIGFEIVYGPVARGRLLGDAVRLRQIVSNLASNAVKFTNAGKVTVRVDIDAAAAVHGGGGDLLTLAVEDTGVGFDAETGARLFSRFEQADASITRTYGGTGLGLSICKSLATLMGGTIAATSTPGVGSVFTVRLPISRTVTLAAYDAEAQEPEPTAVLAGPAANDTVRVLAAEDHPTNRRVLELMLAPFGITATLVEDGRQAVEAWEAGAFDLILMDMQMPVMDGLAATRAIRAREAETGRPRTPIAMLSANAMPEHVAAALDAGCEVHIAKPVTPQSLIKGVSAAIAAVEAAQCGAGVAAEARFQTV